MATKTNPIRLPYDPSQLVERLLDQERRLLLLGESGIGKSTLAAKLAAELAEQGRRCFCLSADPGSPAFGVPGAVNLAVWEGQAWQPLEQEAVCSLDSGRFRLPLLLAVATLAQRLPEEVVLIDTPGMVRGLAAAELLQGLLHLLNRPPVLVVARERRRLPQLPLLRVLAEPLHWVQASVQAHSPSRIMRARQRTSLWSAYLSDQHSQVLNLRRLPILGIPPPQRQPQVWPGRQIGLLSDGRTVALGEVIELKGGRLRVQLPGPVAPAQALLIRDAARVEQLLVTSRPSPEGVKRERDLGRP